MKSAFHPEAQRELLEAIDYYNDAEPGLGLQFFAEIQSAIELVEVFPDLWMEVESGIRRCLVRRFPYAILYSREGDEIFIYAIMHTRRHPDYWKDRISHG